MSAIIVSLAFTFVTVEVTDFQTVFFPPLWYRLVLIVAFSKVNILRKFLLYSQLTFIKQIFCIFICILMRSPYGYLILFQQISIISSSSSLKKKKKSISMKLILLRFRSVILRKDMFNINVACTWHKGCA